MCVCGGGGGGVDEEKTNKYGLKISRVSSLLFAGAGCERQPGAAVQVHVPAGPSAPNAGSHRLYPAQRINLANRRAAEPPGHQSLQGESAALYRNVCFTSLIGITDWHWPHRTTLAEKLSGPKEDLLHATNFINATKLDV